MAPTSEERREVAQRMRDEAEGYRRTQRVFGYDARIDTGDIPGVFQDLCAFVGLKGYVRCAEILDRLADLIEPQKPEEEKDRLIVDALELLDTIYNDYRNLRRSVVYEPEDVWCYGKAEDELLMEGRKRIKALKKLALSLGIESDEDDGFYEL